MLSQKIRKQFLDYFKNKGHMVVPSSPVVPHEDPTLLFNNAGMNQFKDVFLGKSSREYKRATSSQKCIRVGGKHNDLDNVGHTSRHLTFFEMLGNFSFGDYFKKEAIDFAWQLSTEVFEFSPELLWITVFEDDDEAFELWKKYMPSERIVRMGEKDNFWAMGDTGPCGPCSELYLDRGKKYGNYSHLKEDVSGERYLEFWNLVFMQYNRDTKGKMYPLPNQSIDTGSGLERVVALKMQVDNVFHTDILRHLIEGIEKVCGKVYKANEPVSSAAFHVIADHVRSLAFAIADGAQPSNIERGYVLRKLLRRAVRYGRTLLGMEGPFLAKIFPFLLETMGSDYHELRSAESRIAEIFTAEEEAFIRTLKRGGNILSSIVEEALASPLKQISGKEAFKLKDTYGFPLEEILLIAKDSGVQVNIDAYQLLEEEAKERSRKSHAKEEQEVTANLFASFVEKQGATAFVGYSDVKTETEIVALIHEGEFVQSLSEPHEGLVILRKTPFYPEKGGQVADFGTISHSRALFRVKDCQTPFPGVIVHKGEVQLGVLHVGDSVVAAIDETRRAQIAAHHTATHILHWALQEVLGGHIRQAGSLVEPDRLRFDFNHHKSLSTEEIDRIEALVNAKIRENQSVSTYETSFESIHSHPEIKQFFGEKYGATVRVVDIDYSKELCGGTHAFHVGMLGYFRILKESSIAAGVRRIEACCGLFAEHFVKEQEGLLHEAATVLKTKTTQLIEKLTSLMEESVQLKAELKAFKAEKIKKLAEELAKQVENIGSVRLLTYSSFLTSEEIHLLAEHLLGLLQSAVVALIGQSDQKVQLIIRVSSDLVAKGIGADKLVKKAASFIGGSGGGRAETAQAGGKNTENIPAVFNAIRETLSSL